MKMVNSIWFYGPGMTTFTHKVFILTTFVTQSFDLKMTYFPKIYFWMLLLRRGPKAPRRAPKPSAGARRRGAERPELLVSEIWEE